MVVQHGVNEHQILPMARHFRGTGIELRFIEYMDVGSTNGWQHQHVMPSAQVQALIASEYPLVARTEVPPASPLKRGDYVDGQGRVGFISSVTQASLWRLQSHSPLDRRQALHLPVRQPGLRPSRPLMRSGWRRGPNRSHEPGLAGPRRPVFATA